MNDAWHKEQYDAALRYADRKGPAWEELTEEQRANIRKINDDQNLFMNKLGMAIRTGGPLPDPFE